MSNKGTRRELTAPIWFDQWTRQAESRSARKREVTEALLLIANVLTVAGLLVTLIGVMWIDSMDVTSGNVILSLVGIVTLIVGARFRIEAEFGGYR